MCLRIDRRIEPGQTVVLHHGPQLKVKARVAWIRRLANCTEFGVQFHDRQEAISEWTEYFQPNKPEPLLALPAPEHSTRFTSPQIYTGFGRSGKSWQTARRIISQQ